MPKPLQKSIRLTGRSVVGLSGRRLSVPTGRFTRRASITRISVNPSNDVPPIHRSGWAITTSRPTTLMGQSLPKRTTHSLEARILRLLQFNPMPVTYGVFGPRCAIAAIPKSHSESVAQFPALAAFVGEGGSHRKC